MKHLAIINHTTGEKAWATREEIQTLALLDTLQKGGIATVNGYRPTSGYVVIPTVNITFISRFSTEKLYERKVAALEALSFEGVEVKAPKLTALSEEDQRAQFDACKAAMIGSVQKTQEGDRNDAHRAGHDRCYITSSMGVKVHLDTAKGDDKLMHPVLTDGFPSVKSVMVHFIELGRKVVVEGEYKVVNSGPKVLMDQCIEKALNQRSVGFKSLSLKEGNFESLKMGGEAIRPEDVLTLVRQSARMVDAAAVADILETEDETVEV